MVSAVDRRDLMAQQDDRPDRERRDQQPDGDPVPGDVARSERVARAERLPDPDRQGRRQAHRQHEGQGREVERDLVCGDLHLAEPADQNRDARERSDFSQPRAAHRQADPQQSLLGGPGRPCP